MYAATKDFFKGYLEGTQAEIQVGSPGTLHQSRAEVAVPATDLIGPFSARTHSRTHVRTHARSQARTHARTHTRARVQAQTKTHTHHAHTPTAPPLPAQATELSDVTADEMRAKVGANLSRK